jgi:hypothetical protein
MHGRGVFTSAQGGWTYSGALERDRPTEGELVEADGRRFKVTYAKDCSWIGANPNAKTKVCVVLRRRSCLRCARVRARQRACAVLVRCWALRRHACCGHVAHGRATEALLTLLS